MADKITCLKFAVNHGWALRNSSENSGICEFTKCKVFYISCGIQEIYMTCVSRWKWKQIVIHIDADICLWI